MDKRLNVSYEDLKLTLVNQCRLAQHNVYTSAKQIQLYKDEIKKLQKLIEFHEEKLEQQEISLMQANIALGNIQKVVETEEDK